jgi:hypothetical protein
MRKLILPIILLLLFTLSCEAGQVTFQWDLSASEPLGTSGGYRLYQSKVSQTYSTTPVATVAAGITTVTINPSSGTYFWVVTAFDGEGNESGYSNEVTAKVKPGVPALLRITLNK